jgi:hypothetical protein
MAVVLFIIGLVPVTIGLAVISWLSNKLFGVKSKRFLMLNLSTFLTYALIVLNIIMASEENDPSDGIAACVIGLFIHIGTLCAFLIFLMVKRTLMKLPILNTKNNDNEKK